MAKTNAPDRSSSAVDPLNAAKRRRKLILIAGIALILLLILAVVITVVLVRGRNNNGSNSSSDGGNNRFEVFTKIRLDFEGPSTSEKDPVNPFLDYRLDCEFTLEGDDKVRLLIPGFFAADGDAAESSSTSGNVWRCWFTPPRAGNWNWRANFVQGSNVAVSKQSSGTKDSSIDGKSGKFKVEEMDSSIRGKQDNRGKGFLLFVGKRYMQWSGTKDYFLGGGCDSPEGLLNYEGFDATGNGNTRGWKAHEGDWNDNDLTWKGGKGKGLVGVINYIADVKKLNSIAFLTFSHLGQDGGVFPTIGDPKTEKLRYDVSKLAQWDLLFNWMSAKGLMIHVKLMEAQSYGYHDDGKLGVERALYYREIVARFGHHLSIVWNLGEEIANEKADGLSIPYKDARSFADYIRSIDAYRHPILLHTWPTNEVKTPYYRQALADGPGSPIEGFSLQGHSHINRYFDDTKRWVEESAAAGAPKVITSDEQGPFESGILSDARDPSHFGNRTGPLWGHYLAGGAGHMAYFGMKFPQSDNTVDDLRSRDAWYSQVAHALNYFKINSVPLPNLQSSETLTSNAMYAFYVPGSQYHVQLVSRRTTHLNLEKDNGAYRVSWYDPTKGGALQSGSVECVSGGGWTGLGSPPGGSWKGKDWIIRLQADSKCTGQGNPDAKTDCKGAFIRSDAAFEDCCLSADVEFTLVLPGGTAASGTKFAAETGLCNCKPVSGLKLGSTDLKTGISSFTKTTGPMRLTCTKPWEPSGKACAPTLVSLGSLTCIS